MIGAAFTHADLAHMVGATRQWVTISLKRLQEKRIVLIDRKSKIVVLPPNMLEEMRGQDGLSLDAYGDGVCWQNCARAEQPAFDGN